MTDSAAKNGQQWLTQLQTALAHCSTECPLYAEMPTRALAAAEAARRPTTPASPADPRQPEASQETAATAAPAPAIERVKDRFEEQFRAGWHFVQGELAKGTKIPVIVALLNERGLKTRTGRKWTEPILRRERCLAAEAANTKRATCRELLPDSV